MHTLSFCALPVCLRPLVLSFLANTFSTLPYYASPSAVHPSFSTSVSLSPPQTTNHATNTSYTLLLIWRSWNQALVLCQFPVGVPISRSLLEYNVMAAEPKAENPNAASHCYRYLVFNTRNFPILGLRSRRATNLRVTSEGKTLVGCLLGTFMVYSIYWLCCVG
jgi:hypothetical protein